MKKNLLKILLCIALTMLTAFSLSACGGMEKPNDIQEIDYKINFIVDSEIYHAITINDNDKIIMPQNPTKENYDFVGWFFDKDIWEDEFDKRIFNYVDITKNLTLYAKFEEKSNATGQNAFIFNSGTIVGLTDYGKTLTDFIIPETINETPVSAIGNKAFYEFFYMRSVVVPESVKIIGSNAFAYCSALTNVVLGDGVEIIENNAFAWCDNLSTVEIGNSVKNISEKAFFCCNSLTSIVVNNDNINYKTMDGNLYSKDGKTLVQYAIGNQATNFVVSDSVLNIGDYAFATCSNLESVIIPSSVTSIGKYAFNSCNGLTKIIIPKETNSIGVNVFGGCVKLTIYCEVTSKPWGWASNWAGIMSVFWYSSSTPTSSGNFWYYDENDNIVIYPGWSDYV